MRGDTSRLPLVLVTLTLGMVGGLLGVFAFGELSGRAGAAGSVTEQAEVTLVAEDFTTLTGTVGGPYDGSEIASVGINTSRFPAGTSFTFNVSGVEEYNNSHCFRLARAIAWGSLDPVPDSEVCATGPSANQYFALRSGALTLSSGDNIYVFQWRHTSGAGGGSAFLGTARVVAEWQDYSPPVGGIAVFPDISSSTGQNYAVLVGLAFVAVVAFAAGGWYARRRWVE